MLDNGKQVQYCYCGAGWYRQQFEGIFEKPVCNEIVRSVLRGDDVVGLLFIFLVIFDSKQTESLRSFQF